MGVCNGGGLSHHCDCRWGAVVWVGSEQHFLRAPSHRLRTIRGRYSVTHEKACGAVGRDLAGDRRGRGGPAGLFWLFAAELCGGGDGCRHGRGRTDELPRCQPQGQVPIAAALGLSLNWLPVLFANIGATVIEPRNPEESGEHPHKWGCPRSRPPATSRRACATYLTYQRCRGGPASWLPDSNMARSTVLGRLACAEGSY